jgi:hypothetical protein
MFAPPHSFCALKVCQLGTRFCSALYRDDRIGRARCLAYISCR